MNAGETFLFPPESKHLWMIISDPAQDTVNVLAVYFSTWESYKDQACIVQAGEHPFVTHKTIVAYEFARMESAATWEKLKADRLAIPRQPLPPELLFRVRQSAHHSRIRRDWFHHICDQGLVDTRKLKPTL